MTCVRNDLEHATPLPLFFSYVFRYRKLKDNASKHTKKPTYCLLVHHRLF